MAIGNVHTPFRDVSAVSLGKSNCPRLAAAQGLISSGEVHFMGMTHCDPSKGDDPPHSASLMQTKASSCPAASFPGESHRPYTLTLYLPETVPKSDLAKNFAPVNSQGPPKPLQPQLSEPHNEVHILSSNLDCPTLEVDSGHSTPWPPPAAGVHVPEMRPRACPNGPGAPRGRKLLDEKTRRNQNEVPSSAATTDEPRGHDLEVCASVVKGVAFSTAANENRSLEGPFSRWDVLLSSNDADQGNPLSKGLKHMDPDVRDPACEFGPSTSVCTEAESTRRHVSEPCMEHSGLEDMASVNNNRLSLMSGGKPCTYVRPKTLRRVGHELANDDVAAASSCGLADQCDAPTENLNSIFFFL